MLVLLPLLISIVDNNTVLGKESISFSLFDCLDSFEDKLDTAFKSTKDVNLCLQIAVSSKNK